MNLTGIMKGIVKLFLSALFAVSLTISSFAQIEAQPSAAEDAATRLLTEAELDVLLGPIALYPDPLLAVLLPAATHPTEIVLAVRYLNSGGELQQIEAQPWDENVKALAAYTDVLRWMDENLEWSADLGETFLHQ